VELVRLIKYEMPTIHKAELPKDYGNIVRSAGLERVHQCCYTKKITGFFKVSEDDVAEVNKWRERLENTINKTSDSGKLHCVYINKHIDDKVRCKLCGGSGDSLAAGIQHATRTCKTSPADTERGSETWTFFAQFKRYTRLTDVRNILDLDGILEKNLIKKDHVTINCHGLELNEQIINEHFPDSGRENCPFAPHSSGYDLNCKTCGGGGEVHLTHRLGKHGYQKYDDTCAFEEIRWSNLENGSAEFQNHRIMNELINKMTISRTYPEGELKKKMADIMQPRGKNVQELDGKPSPGPSCARDKVPKVTTPRMTGGTSCTSSASDVRRRLTSADVVLARLKTLSTSRSPEKLLEETNPNGE